MNHSEFLPKKERFETINKLLDQCTQAQIKPIQEFYKVFHKVSYFDTIKDQQETDILPDKLIQAAIGNLEVFNAYAPFMFNYMENWYTIKKMVLKHQKILWDVEYNAQKEFFPNLTPHKIPTTDDEMKQVFLKMILKNSSPLINITLYDSNKSYPKNLSEFRKNLIRTLKELKLKSLDPTFVADKIIEKERNNELMYIKS